MDQEVTEAFNRSAKKTGSGKRIVVTAIPMAQVNALTNPFRRQKETHITSPASAAFVKDRNAKSRAKTGHDLLGPTDNLVLSPVVIPCGKPMAESHRLGQEPDWLGRHSSSGSKHRRVESLWLSAMGTIQVWPYTSDYSNSGLISLFAETYAAVNKKSWLEPGRCQ